MVGEVRPQDGAVVCEWEAGLPTTDDLPPLSKSLIPPELASAFEISPEPPQTAVNVHRASQSTLTSLRSHPPSADPDGHDPVPESKKARRNDGEDTSFEADEDQSTANRTHHKKPRLVWTSMLHNRFVEVVAQLGLNTAVPKTIMERMNVDGLTRENVASHLQKYRLYLKRQGSTNDDGGSLPSSDHHRQFLAESSNVSSSNNHNGGGNGGSYGHMGMMPMAMPYHQPQHPQMMMMMSSPGHGFPSYYHQQQQQSNRSESTNEYSRYSHRTND